MRQASLHRRAADMPLRAEHAPSLIEIARSETGIRLTPEKLETLKPKLARSAIRSGAGSFDEYIVLLRRDPATLNDYAETLTIHTTSFFRERGQFTWMDEEGLPELAGRRSQITIWSAACSTGQEGYTGLMVAERFRRRSPRSFSLRLVGTDISEMVLGSAASGIYGPEEMGGISDDVRCTYFMKSRSGDGRHRIVPELRSLAEWRQANLVSGKGLQGIEADIAFLRNVLIYFDEENQGRVIKHVTDRIRPGGFLLTGHSESGIRHPSLTSIRPSIYRKD